MLTTPTIPLSSQSLYEAIHCKVVSFPRVQWRVYLASLILEHLTWFIPTSRCSNSGLAGFNCRFCDCLPLDISCPKTWTLFFITGACQDGICRIGINACCALKNYVRILWLFHQIFFAHPNCTTIGGRDDIARVGSRPRKLFSAAIVLTYIAAQCLQCLPYTHCSQETQIDHEGDVDATSCANWALCW